MIKKIRYKFVAILMISLTLLLLFMVIAINWINFNSITKSTDKVLDVLQENDNKFPTIESKPNYYSSQTPFETRFFTVSEIKKDSDNIKKGDYNVDLKSYTFLDDDDIYNMVISSVFKNNNKGYYLNFRYRKYQPINSNTYTIIFLDCSKQLIPIDNFFKISMIVISVGLVLSFVIIFYVSKLIVKPIEESNNKQKKFITDAGHELKTPLTIISANNELLEMINGENEMTQTISKEVKRMTAMVKKITELSQLTEEDSLKQNETTLFSFSEVVSTYCSDISNIFFNKNINFKFYIQENIFIKGNKSKLQELVSIILDNAYKYSLTNCYVSLFIKKDKIVLLERNDSKDIRVGNYDKVFSRFYRSDEVRASDIEGSGIGLSIAKEIVSLNSGTIKAFGDKEKFFNIEVTFNAIKNKKVNKDK